MVILLRRVGELVSGLAAEGDAAEVECIAGSAIR